MPIDLIGSGLSVDLITVLIGVTSYPVSYQAPNQGRRGQISGTIPVISVVMIAIRLVMAMGTVVTPTVIPVMSAGLVAMVPITVLVSVPVVTTLVTHPNADICPARGSDRRQIHCDTRNCQHQGCFQFVGESGVHDA